MKIFCFYLYGTTESIKKYDAILKDDIIIEHENLAHCLYAFTPAKDIADFFQITRKSDIFYRKEIEIDREDFESFCSDYQLYLLEYHLFSNKVVDETGRITTDGVYLLTTTLESDLVLYNGQERFYDIISNSCESLAFLNAYTFKKDICKALNDLCKFDELTESTYPREDDDISSLTINGLSLYCHLFSNTYSEEGLNAICSVGSFLKNQKIKTKKYQKVFL